MNLYTTLKRLCLVSSVSGRESKIRNEISDIIAPFVDKVEVDALGNLIALKKGKGEKKIMLCAHMDEIGFIVNFIEENGMIRVGTLGGIRLAAASFSTVVSEKGVKGALCANADVRPEDYKSDAFYIDIGAKSRKEAERYVSIGDTFVCEPSLTKLCGSRVCGRPLDDRVGCLALLEIAERLSGVELDTSVYFVFSVQEEVGCRGSKPATFAIAPDVALCFDVTATGDVPGAKPMACALGEGVAIKIKDNSVICHPELVATLCEIAKEEKIPYQREVLTFGGTDTSSMQLTGYGSVAGALSIPTRYVHSSVEVCDMKDVEASISLAEKYIISLG
ncbi:MAG: M42 family metallopeptidase [Clostridia bacterium]|nr:M42 family metallopeptidase [Clostridia bacterium]